jgi:hypothetical protein
MENKKLIKVLLTILTVIVIVVLPIWIGPSKIDNKAISLILEWALGFGITVAAALGMAIVGYIGYIIYDFWSEIID